MATSLLGKSRRVAPTYDKTCNIDKKTHDKLFKYLYKLRKLSDCPRLIQTDRELHLAKHIIQKAHKRAVKLVSRIRGLDGPTEARMHNLRVVSGGILRDITSILRDLEDPGRSLDIRPRLNSIHDYVVHLIYDIPKRDNGQDKNPQYQFPALQNVDMTALLAQFPQLSLGGSSSDSSLSDVGSYRGSRSSLSGDGSASDSSSRSRSRPHLGQLGGTQSERVRKRVFKRRGSNTGGASAWQRDRTGTLTQETANREARQVRGEEEYSPRDRSRTLTSEQGEEYTLDDIDAILGNEQPNTIHAHPTPSPAVNRSLFDDSGYGPTPPRERPTHPPNSASSNRPPSSAGPTYTAPGTKRHALRSDFFPDMPGGYLVPSDTIPPSSFAYANAAMINPLDDDDNSMMGNAPRGQLDDSGYTRTAMGNAPRGPLDDSGCTVRNDAPAGACAIADDDYAVINDADVDEDGYARIRDVSVPSDLPVDDDGYLVPICDVPRGVPRDSTNNGYLVPSNIPLGTRNAGYHVPRSALQPPPRTTTRPGYSVPTNLPVDFEQPDYNNMPTNAQVHDYVNLPPNSDYVNPPLNPNPNREQDTSDEED